MYKNHNQAHLLGAGAAYLGRRVEPYTVITTLLCGQEPVIFSHHAYRRHCLVPRRGMI